MNLFELTLLAFFPVFAFLFHAVALRFFFLRRLPNQLGALTAVVLAAILVSSIILFREWSLVRAFFSLCLCFGLGHVYFHIFNMSETARRIRLLVGIETGAGNTESAPEPYQPEQLIRVRMERLVKLKQIEVQESGHYKSHPSLLLYVALVLKAYEDLLFPQRRTRNSN